jgi:hypothetical protein
MTLNGFGQVFGVACLGGALLELYKWYRLRESPNMPFYVRRVSYWLITLAMTVAGGLLATLYGTAHVQAVLALNIGLSAPAILRTLAGSAPERQVASPGRRRSAGNAPGPSLRGFLAGV